jgi:MtrB/PioB family decaheme-associated outer membrane protein
MVIATILVTPGVQAEEAGALGWTCELCPPASGWELDIRAGLGYVTSDDYRFGDYTGLDDSGLYLSGDVFARYWGEDAEFIRFDGYRLGQDSRAMFLKGGKQGMYKVRASYQGITRKIFDTTSTPYLGSGHDTLSLPAGWVRAPTTQGMTQLGSSSQGVKIERDWDIYSVGAGYTPTSNWTFDANFRRQERDGKAVSSGSFFFDSAMFASPVDDATDEVEVSASYSADYWQVNLSYLGSFYDNDNSSLTWDNAYTAGAPGADTGRMALAPDNDSHQVTLAGSMTLPRSTILNGAISLGRMEQDENFLPYTSNALIATGVLPRNSANAKVDTTNVNLRAVSSPWKKVTLQGEFRYNERDNKTSENTYNYVVTDLFNSTDSASNVAYDYERYDYRLRGEYRLPARTRLYAGYDYERDERNSQERDKTTTDRVWAQARAKIPEIADVNFKIYTEERDGSSYKTIINVPDPENPLMRKFNMANRDRDGFKVHASTYASERFNLGIEYEYNEDDYNDSFIGLTKTRYKRYGFEASYLFPGNISLYTSFYKENIKARQANSQSFSGPDWGGKTEDIFYTNTTGIRYPDFLGHVDVSLEYNSARSNGETTNDTSGLASEFPNLNSTLNQLKLGVEYPYNKSLTFGFNYMYESFETDDWMLEGVGPATVPNLLSLGADPYDDHTHVFFVGLRYVFDSRGQSGARMGAQSYPF